MMVAPARAGTVYQELKSLGVAGAPGQRPYGGVAQGNDGTFYGTTLQGGTNGAGTVFRLNRDGSGYTTLHTFTTNGVDGRSPNGLIVGTDGALYGTSSIGGSHGAGTVYKLNTNGTSYSVLHNFVGTVTDGQFPQAGLAQGSDGALYGTTFFGGSSGMGTVFKLNTNGGGYSVLLAFSGASGDGANPDTAVVQGRDGALYGTTFLGGTNDTGTVFKLNTNGAGYSVLRSSAGAPADGENPNAALIQGSDGLLYGTTYSGGSNGVGAIFKLGTNGANYSLLHVFGQTPGDGQDPLGALLEGRDGSLYGTTYSGGANGAGTIFGLNKDGTGYTVWRSFSSAGGDGEDPHAGLVIGSNGAFYGTTWSGGAAGFGTVFRLFPPETPQMIDAAMLGKAVRVRFAGMSGYSYQVLRSTNLTNWSLLNMDTITAPASGIGTNIDNAPPPSGATYRAAWVP
jgi:uncharacterized repeat protein (TIGR03803 family)